MNFGAVEICEDFQITEPALCLGIRKRHDRFRSTTPLVAGCHPAEVCKLTSILGRMHHLLHSDDDEYHLVSVYYVVVEWNLR